MWTRLSFIWMVTKTNKIISICDRKTEENKESWMRKSLIMCVCVTKFLFCPNCIDKNQSICTRVTCVTCTANTDQRDAAVNHAVSERGGCRHRKLQDWLQLLNSGWIKPAAQDLCPVFTAAAVRSADGCVPHQIVTEHQQCRRYLGPLARVSIDCCCGDVFFLSQAGSECHSGSFDKKLMEVFHWVVPENNMCGDQKWEELDFCSTK